MTVLSFERAVRYSGHKAYVSVVLTHAYLGSRVDMVLDTGAEISLLNRQFIAPLDLTVTDGEAITLIVANGDVAQAWIHSVTVDVFDRRLVVPMAICPEWDTQNLLGMRGFFDQMVVAFDHANRTIHS